MAIDPNEKCTPVKNIQRFGSMSPVGSLSIRPMAVICTSFMQLIRLVSLFWNLLGKGRKGWSWRPALEVHLSGNFFSRRLRRCRMENQKRLRTEGQRERVYFIVANLHTISRKMSSSTHKMQMPRILISIV